MPLKYVDLTKIGENSESPDIFDFEVMSEISKENKIVSSGWIQYSKDPKFHIGDKLNLKIRDMRIEGLEVTKILCRNTITLIQLRNGGDWLYE